jgi:cell division septum initiation protein DivIVA
MTDPTENFRVVLRGYDPAQVDRRISDLQTVADKARGQLDQLNARVRELEEEQSRGADGESAAPTSPASFTHLGERVGQILSLADDEADEIRRRAHAELDAERKEVSETSGRIRGEADRYAEGRHRDADTESARILEDARRAADERIDGADRDAAARIQEAEAVYEDQRARAAKAAADFETTLAERRKVAEAEFTKQSQDTQQRLEEVERHLERTRAEADETQAEAGRQARRMLEDAESQAAAMVNDAKTVAARVRSDSERELVAATQRRDSINAQLSNVRQMLVTLTGTAPAAFAEDAFGDAAEPQGEQGEQGDEQGDAELAAAHQEHGE